MSDASTPPATGKSPASFVRLVMLAAGIVTVLRFFTLTNLGYDVTLQVQAAQHLLGGQGLKVFWTVPTDLSEPLALKPLTHFPAGFSLMTAALLGAGLPLALVTKVFGAALTLAGWLGWARFGALCVGSWLDSARGATVAARVLALTCPLFFTPDWNGTDIFLWASVPWVLGWLAHGALLPVFAAARWDALAGALCGLCVSMRYAGLVLAGYAGLVMLLQCWRRPATLLGRWTVFGIALAPLVLLQAQLILAQPGHAATPGGIDSGRGSSDVAAGVVNGAKLLTTANYPFVAWAPERVVRFLTTPGNRAPWLYAIVTLTSLLPWLVAKRIGKGTISEAMGDPRVVAAGFAFVVPLFLWVCTALGEYPALANRRYYLPLVPLVLFLLWHLASPSRGALAPWIGWVRQVTRLFVVASLVAMGAATAFLFVPTAHGAVQRARLMGDADLGTFPRLGLSYESLSSRQFVLEQLQSDPKLVLLTNFEQWFYADSSVDRSRIQRIERCETARHWVLSGPAKLLVLAFDQGAPLAIHYIHWDGRVLPAECFDALPNLRLLKTFPSECAKVLECEVPAGVIVVFDGEKAPTVSR